VDAVIFNLRWWLMGQMVLMITLWVTTTVALWLMGIPLALRPAAAGAALVATIFPLENGCNRSFAGVRSSAGVAAEAQVAFIWERSVQGDNLSRWSRSRAPRGDPSGKARTKNIHAVRAGRSGFFPRDRPTIDWGALEGLAPRLYRAEWNSLRGARLTPKSWPRPG
jgi:hypothetical protein